MTAEAIVNIIGVVEYRRPAGVSRRHLPFATK
jgi:hypothetical protein